MQFTSKFTFISFSQPDEVIAEPPEERASVKLDPDIWPNIISMPSDSGILVNEATALNLSSVWSAVKLLSESVAGLPFQVFETVDGGKVLRKDHPVYPIIHSQPNQLQTKFTFFQSLMTSVLLYGNAYAMIKKDKFARPKSLIFLHPEDVTVMVTTKNTFMYEITYNGENMTIPARDMIHVLGLSTDGYVGQGVVKVAENSIGLGMAAEKFGNKFFSNGANSETAFESPAQLTDEQFNRLRKVLENRHSGLNNSHRPLLLEGGMTIKPLTIPPDQAQFLQTRKFQTNEIARWFNIPPHMIGDLERSTNNNIEQQSIEYVQYALMPWVNRIEAEFSRKLFYEDEKPAIFAEFNVEGLLRGDVKARSEFYRVLWNVGAIENMNPYEGGDEHYRPINTISIENPVYDTSKNTNAGGE